MPGAEVPPTVVEPPIEAIPAATESEAVTEEAAAAALDDAFDEYTEKTPTF